MVTRRHQSAKTSAISTKPPHERQSREAGSCMGREAAYPMLSVALRISPRSLKARQYWIFGSVSMTTEK